MVRNIENGVALIEKWLRNKNTIEFLGIWEELYNEQFDYDEYCNVMQKAGRYGGTYAYKDIAFEFIYI